MFTIILMNTIKIEWHHRILLSFHGFTLSVEKFKCERVFIRDAIDYFLLRQLFVVQWKQVIFTHTFSELEIAVE